MNSMDIVNSETGQPYTYRAKVKGASRAKATKALAEMRATANVYGEMVSHADTLWIYYDYHCMDCGGVGRREVEDSLCSSCAYLREIASARID